MSHRRDWPPADVDVRDSAIDYLAFCAARDELRRRSRTAESLMMRVLGTGPGASRVSARGPAEWREVENERFQEYVLACYAVAQRFNGEDRNVLKLAGILPREFYNDVETELRHQRKAKSR